MRERVTAAKGRLIIERAPRAPGLSVTAACLLTATPPNGRAERRMIILIVGDHGHRPRRPEAAAGDDLGRRDPGGRQWPHALAAVRARRPDLVIPGPELRAWRFGAAAALIQLEVGRILVLSHCTPSRSMRNAPWTREPRAI